MLKRIYNSPTIMSWISNFVRFGSLIFVLPLILTTYSEIEQSLWFLTGTIVGFAMLADSGFGSVLVRAVSYFNTGAETIPKNKEEYDQIEVMDEKREPNYEKLVDLLTTSNRVYLFLGLLVIIMLLTIGVAFVWNVMSLAGHRFDFWLAFGLLIPYCYLTILTIKWSSFMRGFNYVALEARLSTLTSSGRILLFIVALLLGLKPAALIGIMLLEAIVKLWYLKRFLLNWFNEHDIKIANSFNFNKDIFWSIWPATWKLGGIFWGNYLVDSGNSVIIAQINDASLMSSFLFTVNIIAFIKSAAQTPFYANIPTIYSLAAQKKLDEMRNKSAGYIAAGLFLMTGACVFIGLFGNNLLELLGSQTRFIEPWLYALLCLSVMLDMHASFHASIYTSTNHIPFLIPSLVSGILIISVGFLILPVYGLAGILLTRFLIQLSFNNWYSVYLSLKLLDWPFARFLYEMPTNGLQFILKSIRWFIPFRKR